MNFFDSFCSLINNDYFLLAATSISFFFKILLLIKLFQTRARSFSPFWPSLFLSLALIGSSIVESDWIFVTTKQLFFGNPDSRFFIFWNRIVWAFLIVQYHSLALFTESLVTPDFKFNIRHKISIALSGGFFSFFIGIALYDINRLNFLGKPLIELIIRKIEYNYGLYVLLPASIAIVLWNLYSKELPHILKKQMALLMVLVIAPFWFFDLVQMICFPFFAPENLNQSNLSAILSVIFFVAGTYYCSRKIIGLRFLNLSERVTAPIRHDVMTELKRVLAQFSKVDALSEMGHIIKGFFKDTFGIPIEHVDIHIRETSYAQGVIYSTSTMSASRSAAMETFLKSHSPDVCAYIRSSAMLTYDEIDYDYFYHKTGPLKEILDFLRTSNTDIFLPIIEDDKVIAYITVNRAVRKKPLYTSVEHDEMYLFGNYLGKIIRLVQARDMEYLAQQKNILNQELYQKHQEVNQYKESFKSFLHASKEQSTGLLFHKDGHYTFGNHAGRELIQANPNAHDGHPVVKELNRAVEQARSYKSTQQRTAYRTDGQKLMLCAYPNTAYNNIAVMVNYPQVSDVIKKQLEKLPDPSQWDYLLYLETTKSGRLVNELIPGDGPTMLEFKINLLKAALSKRPTLLDIPEDDVQAAVEILHHISLRETLHVMDLTERAKNLENAIDLFGLNPIFNGNKIKIPLLEKLDEKGTLFINNIHLLEAEAQKELASFMRYGYFQVYKSTQKVHSNVRILCATDRNLQKLVDDGSFNADLLAELKRSTITMPSLNTLADEEISALVYGFGEQIMSTDELFKDVLALSEADRSRITGKKPTSLQEVKHRVHQFLAIKKRKGGVYKGSYFDPAVYINDPELVAAVRMGKKALRDKKVLTFLWQRFKNQAKIAKLLGVNRSSVCRRCKEYGLVDD